MPNPAVRSSRVNLAVGTQQAGGEEPRTRSCTRTTLSLLGLVAETKYQAHLRGLDL
jgi:hypothetical protein